MFFELISRQVKGIKIDEGIDLFGPNSVCSGFGVCDRV